MSLNDSEEKVGRLCHASHIKWIHSYYSLAGAEATPRRGTRLKKLSLRAQEALCFRQSVDSVSSVEISEETFECDSNSEVLKPSGRNYFESPCIY